VRRLAWPHRDPAVNILEFRAHGIVSLEDVWCSREGSQDLGNSPALTNPYSEQLGVRPLLVMAKV
jgi:hypothetical protein